VNRKPQPAVAVPGAVTTKCDAAAALTVIGPLVLVIVQPTPFAFFEVAVSVWLPAVVKVVLNTPTPLTNVPRMGMTVNAPVSLLAKVTVPV
jgi:hypothetical protein